MLSNNINTHNINYFAIISGKNFFTRKTEVIAPNPLDNALQ